MLVIQVHGCFLFDNIDRVEERIFKAIEGEPYANEVSVEVVVTHCVPHSTAGIKGRYRAYILLLSDDINQAAEIMLRLKALGMPVGHVKLESVFEP